MKIFKVLLVSICILLLSSIGYSANTIVSNGTFISITDIDSDWTYSETIAWASGLRIQVLSIQFNPGAADDHCRVLDTNAAGPPIFDVTSESVYDQREKKYPQPNAGMKPFLDYSEGTYSPGAEVIIFIGQ